jgi:hypothetical protein
MSEPLLTGRVRLELDLAATGDTVVGVLRTNDGGERDVAGWLDLVSALEELLAR